MAAIQIARKRRLRSGAKGDLASVTGSGYPGLKPIGMQETEGEVITTEDLKGTLNPWEYKN
jgi:hypothetical protein